MSHPGFFITGTDTGVGKTWITLGFMAAYQQQDYRTNGMKPVAAGCQRIQGQLIHADALQIQQQADGNPEYETVNPFAFEPPIAPHIAAEAVGCEIDFGCIQQAHLRLQGQAQCTLVEGVGGWRVPLGPGRDVAALVHCLQLPVVLVVGLRLGCLNHALLTAEAIQQQHVLLGWVGCGVVADFAHAAANLKTLQAQIQAPCLGVVPYANTCDPEQIATHLTLPIHAKTGLASSA